MLAIQFFINWTMGGGALTIVLGFLIMIIAFGIFDITDWAMYVVYLGYGLMLGGAVAFLIGIGIAIAA